MYVQTFLLIFVFIFNNGYFTVITRFMLTYFILGPAQFSIDSFVVIQILFWGFFIFGRFFAAYVAFKIDSLKFYLYILSASLLVTLTLMVPFFTQFKIFFWTTFSLLGLLSGPMTPSGFMIAKQILDFNSFILSMFVVGLAIGGIGFQQVTAALLDHFKPRPGWMGFSDPNPSYIIPSVAVSGVIAACLFFIPVLVLHKVFFKKLAR